MAGLLLTTDSMARFVGGQVEVVGKTNVVGQSHGKLKDEHRERNQIKGLKVEGGVLTLEYEYACIWVDHVGFRPNPDVVGRDIPVEGVKATDFGDDRICLSGPRELFMFYPATYHKRVLPDGKVENDHD
jgi:hypothetical protein